MIEWKIFKNTYCVNDYLLINNVEVYGIFYIEGKISSQYIFI
jgi:hypothetical protein